MRYPHTYSLLVVLSIFAAFALSACERVSLRPYPEEAALSDIPSTIIDILPEDERLLAPEGMQEQSAELNSEDDADKSIESSPDAAKNTDEQAALSGAPIEDEKTPEEPPEEALETLISPIYYALDDYTVSFEDKMRLNALAKRLNQPENRHLSLRIEGHCDDRGTRDYNFALGERRAAAVAQFLRAQGVDGSRILTISYGKERPVALGSSEAIRARNRRAQMIIMLGAKN
jgi:peptidoglycan-associated lipoprotein